MRNFLRKLKAIKTDSIAVWINVFLQGILVAIAFLALNVWYEETRGLDKYNVARDALVAIYDLRDVLALVKTTDINVEETALRGGIVWDSEGEPKFPDKRHWTDSAFRSRLEKLRLALDNYYNVIPRIEVVLGEEIREDLNTMATGAEYYYNLGYSLYEGGCHPFDINVQLDPKLSAEKRCIPGLEDFAKDDFVKGFYFTFKRVDMALREVLNN
jgi:hypothetical protein